MALALKCLLELCIVFSAPSIFLLSASHAAVEMQRLLFPAAGKQAGVPGALRLAACAGWAVLCQPSVCCATAPGWASGSHHLLPPKSYLNGKYTLHNSFVF